jgi:hypothetical protein
VSQATHPLHIYSQCRKSVPVKIKDTCKCFMNAMTQGVVKQELNIQFKTMGLGDVAYATSLTLNLYSGKFLYAICSNPSNLSCFFCHRGTHACVMSARYGVGDHRLFVVDFKKGSRIGEAPFRTKQFAACCLNTRVSSGATQKYLSHLEANLGCHCLIERLGKLHPAHKSKQACCKGLN